MTLRKEIEWAVKSICFGAIEVIEGIPKFFIFLYAFAESIGTYLAYGLGMIIGRAVLLVGVRDDYDRFDDYLTRFVLGDHSVYTSSLGHLSGYSKLLYRVF